VSNNNGAVARSSRGTPRRLDLFSRFHEFEFDHI
jgi:hypothetical protein